MQYNNVELNVLIKGRSITEYPHNGQVFVEGRESSAFEISVRNNNPFRVEAVISVDGLSVMDGKEAGINSSGYLVEPGETIKVPGWKLSDAQVASFEFAGKGKSYAAQSTGSSRNTGVIGLMAFKERPGRTNYIAQPHVHNGWLGHGQPSWSSGTPRYDSWNVRASGAVGGEVESFGMARGIGMNTVMMASDSMLAGSAASSDAPVLRAMASNAMSKGMASPSVQVQEIDRSEVAVQNLGTGFGKAQDFKTSTVSFERGDMLAMIVLYYDNARGLRARGINLDRRAKNVATQTPNAFPGMNCAPPPGWRG